jgi:hypothetical protein
VVEDLNTRLVQRVAFSTLIAGLLAGIAFLEVDNSQLANALAKKQEVPVEKPHTNPIEPLPEETDPGLEPEPVPSLVQAIKDKLAADGCNLNADLNVKRKALGNCKILLIGDSLGNNLAYGMIGQLNKEPTLKFVRKAKASTGLSNAWFYNWHNNLATFLKEEKPNLVVVFLGANDRQNYVVNNKVQNFGTEAWKKTYRSNVTKIATASTKAGAYVLWVGMPIMKPYNYAKGITTIDEQYAQAVPLVPGATYLPTRALTADANGNYKEGFLVNGKYAQLRGQDGIHFTAMGQSVMATYVINSIIKNYHVNIRINNPRYVTK